MTSRRSKGSEEKKQDAIFEAGGLRLVAYGWRPTQGTSPRIGIKDWVND